MSNYGFVYCLKNNSFPGLYKIGCTERSPTERAEILSRGTGIPSEYEVVAYFECENHQIVEHDIHRRLATYRPNGSREFFNAPLELIAAHMFFHPENLGWMDRCLREKIGVTVSSLEDPYSLRIAA